MLSANETTHDERGLASTLLMFNWVEYTVFCSMLGFSTLIGIYYGCYKQQNTVSAYLLGGKKMSIFPITISLVASHVSGITLLGVPAETYVYGTQYYAVFFSSVAISILAVFFYIPVLYNLQLNSVYEYLELRFNRSVRVMASLIFASSLILHIPVVIYVPSLAFNQVTGVSLYAIAPVVSLVCIFYTTFGGLKAVVWTDTLQSFFTLATILFIICLGCINVGGVEKVYRIAEEGHRLELFNFDPNPFARNTFWTVSVGTIFSWIANIVIHPGAVQRFTAVPSQKKANGVMLWGCIGTGVVKTLAVIIGLLIYAQYHNCDPIARKVIKKSGQILPYYVMDIGGRFPGLTGLFVSGVVSTALSTMSASLNTVAGTIYEDFVMFFKKERHSEAVASCIMKAIVFIVGVVCIFLVFVVEKLGGIIQMSTTLHGVTSGALVCLFTAGMFIPWTNSKGALSGAVATMLVMIWIITGVHNFVFQGKLKFPGKVTSVDNCSSSTPFFNLSTTIVQNYTGVGTPVIAEEDVSLVYQISYMYLSVVGTVVGLFVCVVVSFITGPQDLSKLDPALVIPQIRHLLPQKQQPPSEDYKLVNGSSAQVLPVESIIEDSH